MALPILSQLEAAFHLVPIVCLYLYRMDLGAHYNYQFSLPAPGSSGQYPKGGLMRKPLIQPFERVRLASPDSPGSGQGVGAGHQNTHY